MPHRIFLLLAATTLLPAGCGWDGHFCIFGYSTRPNYDTSIKTVYVPIFSNDSLFKGLEFDLTRYIVREIEAKTPYKVCSSALAADTELAGKVVTVLKTLVNANQVGEIRQAQVVVTVQVVWRDLRPGKCGDILSAPRKKADDGYPPPGAVPPTVVPSPIPGLQPSIGDPLPVPKLLTGPGVLTITGTGQFEVELGGSLAQAEADALNRIATQIVSMMEIWPAPAAPGP